MCPAKLSYQDVLWFAVVIIFSTAKRRGITQTQADSIQCGHGPDTNKSDTGRISGGGGLKAASP